MFLELSSLLVVLYLLWFYFENFAKRNKAPPGPKCIPPFGNLLQIGFEHKTAHIGLDNLAKKYGDAMSIKMGLMETVILSSYEAVRNVYTKDEACGRLCSAFLWERNLKQNIGLGFAEGPSQVETRKYCREVLKRYGFGDRIAMQTMLLEELNSEFIKHVENEAKSSPESIIHIEPNFFQKCFLNIMVTLLTSNRWTYTDENFQALLHQNEILTNNAAMGTGIMIAYPFLLHVFPEALGYNVVMSGLAGIQKVALSVLNERRNLRRKNSPECFTDSFLDEMEKEKGTGTKVFTEDHYVVLFCDFIQAGADTTSNVVNFTILQLTANPDVQEKVYQEILEVIGPSGFPAIENRQSMPYTQAVILEALRWNRVVVLGPPRKATSDFWYKNYKIKKGTVLMFNLHSIFFNKEFWGDPDVFRPERFLDSNGNLDTKKAEIIQIGFGAGKRNCFGEVFARDSLFIFVTTLIQKFKFSLSPKHPKPSMEPVVGVTLAAPPYDAIVTARTQL